MRWLLIPVFVLFAAYVGIGALLFVAQNRLVHLPDMPSRELHRTPEVIEATWEEIRVPQQDGPALHGWYVEAPRARGTLLFFHGNAGNISHRLESIELFRQLGVHVLIFDYRGYGRSEGSPSEPGLKADAEAVASWLHGERGVPPEETVYFGRSLGGALAAHAAHQAAEPPAGLILESSFTSLPALGADLYPFYPVRWLARMEYDTLGALESVRLPTLVVHSPEDEIVPFHHAERLSAVEHARLLEIRGDHNSGFLTSGALYRDGIGEFLDRTLPRR